MGETLTISLDSDVLALADQQAKAHHTTVSEVVAQQVRVMVRNRHESRAGNIPLTDALRGAVELPSEFDKRAALTEQLQKKHGVSG